MNKGAKRVRHGKFGSEETGLSCKEDGLEASLDSKKIYLNLIEEP